MDPQRIAAELAPRLDGLADEVAVDGDAVAITCRPQSILPLMRALHDGDPAFTYFSFIAGIDHLPEEPDEEEGGEPQPGRMELVYHVVAAMEGIKAFVTTVLPRPGAGPDHPCRVASVAEVYIGAGWHERECYDLLGVEFDGHPDLRRILLVDEWIGHPLLKDYDPSANDLEYVAEKQWPEVASER